MKRTILAVSLALAAFGVMSAQVRLSMRYNYPTLPGSAMDSVLNGLKSIRGCAFSLDVDGDNRSEIAVTNYNDQGRVHIFEAVGNDTMRLVWTSPRVGSGGGASTPRYVMFGDLDNDNKREVIYQSNANGIYIFEWDGVVGSDNYGNQPSQLINPPFITNTIGNSEYMEIGDPDNDAQNELLIAYNASTNATDNYYIIRAVGDWSTGDPGFSSFEVEYVLSRTDPGMTRYGIAAGSPYAMIMAQFDGIGTKEILLHNWNLKNVVPMRTTGPNAYVLPDTLTNRQNVYLGGTFDEVALFGGMAYDVDADGREEVYLPTFPASSSTNLGVVHMISYNVGQPTTQIDSTNVTRLSHEQLTGTGFGYGYGDIDNDGKKDIYISSTYPNNVMSLEFQGGDKRNPANWTARVVYAGDPTIYTALTYRDSVGRRDTIRTIDPSFASKIYGRNTDFDRDGREDIILPYQALSDSMSVRTLVWNSGANRFDTTSNIRVVNPKRWGLRVIERDPGQGVEGKDLTIITPDDYRLEQNYPNPFNPSTTISFYLPIRDRISLKVYDLLGREVRTLINNEEHQAGTGSVVWDGKDNAGRAAATGTYFYTLKFGNFEKTNKAMLVK